MTEWEGEMIRQDTRSLYDEGVSVFLPWNLYVSVIFFSPVLGFRVGCVALPLPSITYTQLEE